MDKKQNESEPKYRLVINRETFSKTEKEKAELKKAKSLWKQSQKAKQ